MCKNGPILGSSIFLSQTAQNIVSAVILSRYFDIIFQTHSKQLTFNFYISFYFEVW